MELSPLAHIESLAIKHPELCRIPIFSEAQRVLHNTLSGQIHEELDKFFHRDRFLQKNHLEEYALKNNVPMLTRIMEYIRAEGLFYDDFTPPDGELLICLLTLAFSLIRENRIYTQEDILQYVQLLYDAIFHSVRFEEMPDQCYILFFKLTAGILDLNPLELSTDGWYTMCLYFIEMTINGFTANKEMFAILRNKIMRLKEKYPKYYVYFEDHWPE